MADDPFLILEGDEKHISYVVRSTPDKLQAKIRRAHSFRASTNASTTRRRLRAQNRRTQATDQLLKIRQELTEMRRGLGPSAERFKLGLEQQLASWADPAAIDRTAANLSVLPPFQQRFPVSRKDSLPQPDPRVAMLDLMSQYLQKSARELELLNAIQANTALLAKLDATVVPRRRPREPSSSSSSDDEGTAAGAGAGAGAGAWAEEVGGVEGPEDEVRPLVVLPRAVEL